MMKRFVSVIFLFMLMMILVTASIAADGWKPVKERHDFKINKPDDFLQKAYKEHVNDYVKLSDLQKGKHYIHSIRSKEYKVDLIFVMIEDLTGDEANSYFGVFFELPSMKTKISSIFSLDGNDLNGYINSALEDEYDFWD
jgi:hypothetical protein